MELLTKITSKKKRIIIYIILTIFSILFLFSSSFYIYYQMYKKNTRPFSIPFFDSIIEQMIGDKTSSDDDKSLISLFASLLGLIVDTIQRNSPLF